MSTTNHAASFHCDTLAEDLAPKSAVTVSGKMHVHIDPAELAAWTAVMQAQQKIIRVKPLALAVAMTLPIHRTERYL